VVFLRRWNGSRGSTPYDAFSTVPRSPNVPEIFPVRLTKMAARCRSSIPRMATIAKQRKLNVIDPSVINASAQSLLAFIPLPNLNSTTQNFHYVTSGSSTSDSVNLRVIHNFGSGGGPGLMTFGGRCPGVGWRRRAQNNINFGMNWTRNSTTLVNPFPSLNAATACKG